MRHGDLGSIDTLHHAELVIPGGHVYDLIRSKGISNLKLMSVLRELCPDAKIITTAESSSKTRELYDHGADFVLQPYKQAGHSLVPAVEAALSGDTSAIKSESMKGLKSGRNSSLVRKRTLYLRKMALHRNAVIQRICLPEPRKENGARHGDVGKQRVVVSIFL